MEGGPRAPKVANDGVPPGTTGLIGLVATNPAGRFPLGKKIGWLPPESESGPNMDGDSDGGMRGKTGGMKGASGSDEMIGGRGRFASSGVSRPPRGISVRVDMFEGERDYEILLALDKGHEKRGHTGGITLMSTKLLVEDLPLLLA